MSRWWTINGRFLTQGVTGVQRYAHEIVSALDDLLTNGQPLGRELNLEMLVPISAPDLPPLRTIKIRRVGRLNGHLWEQLCLPFHARGKILSLCNTSALAAKGQIVCIHDVNTNLFPQSYSMGFRLLYGSLQPAIARDASFVATVSKYSAKNIVNLGWTSSSKLIVAPDGHEHVRRWRPRHSTATSAVAGPSTIVVLGSLAPHKNVNLLLKSAARFASHGFRIALVGGVDRRVFRESDLQAADDCVVRLGSLSDDALAALISDSLCLAFPSVAEGFGLPPLEAMALGCPVVVSDRASLPEVCGEAALYASADDAEEWLNCFLALRDDPGLRAFQIKKGFERIETYRWQESALLYLEAMAYADGIRPKIAAGSGVPNTARLTSANA